MPQGRIATFRCAGLLALAVIMVGCASKPTIISNADTTVDFTSLRSFGFMNPLGTDRGNVRSLLSTQLITATSRELELRGMRRDDTDPDVRINFSVVTQEQIRTRQSSASVGMHRTGRYGTWGGHVSSPTIDQTTEGRISIDMIDPNRMQLIWEGAALSRVTDNIRQNQQEAIDFFVAQIFSEFPL